jgi:hypothetical protein
MKPLQTGLALSATVAIFYSLCTLVEVMLPEQFMGFMNALFHGLDFRMLQSAEPHRWQVYFYALVVLALWGFAIGAFFAWLHDAISKFHYHGAVRHG